MNACISNWWTKIALPLLHVHREETSKGTQSKCSSWLPMSLSQYHVTTRLVNSTTAGEMCDNKQVVDINHAMLCDRQPGTVWLLGIH